MFNPDIIIFSNEVMPYDEFYASEKVHLSEALKPLANSVKHFAFVFFRLLISPFQQTIQFTAYELYSSYRNAELAFGVLLASCNIAYGQYVMYVANQNILKYEEFLLDFTTAREELAFLSQPIFK